MSNSQLLRVQLPIGGNLQAFPYLAGQQPECLAAVNLQTQIAPFLTSVVPLLKILQLLKPLIKIVELLPDPPAAELMQEFANAAAGLAPLLELGGVGATVFARDFLCLQIRSLKCLLRNLEVATEQLSAQPPSAHIATRTVLDSYEPIVGLFGLASGLLAAAGLSLPSAPTMLPGLDSASLKSDHDAIASLVRTLEVATDAMGGC